MDSENKKREEVMLIWDKGGKLDLLNGIMQIIKIFLKNIKG